MTFPWRRAVTQARRFVQSAQLVQRSPIDARAADEELGPKKLSPKQVTSVALGVTFSILVLALIGFAAWYFLIRKPRKATDIESGEKRNWWMVDAKDGEKGGLSEWWRKSYAIPDRVEPPPSAAPTTSRLSLQRLKNVLTRRGAGPDSESAAKKSKVVSPTMTLDLPMQTSELSTTQLHTPRYPSILERSYRVPLYPTQSPPKAPAASRSLTSPAPVQPFNVAERTLAARRKVSVPPRALKLSNGRPTLSLADRKMGAPRSPAHRRRQQLIGHFKHPFIPLKDSDTDFPSAAAARPLISAPMPCAETAATNPKLGYGYAPPASAAARSLSARPRVTPLAPRGARASTRRVPVPILVLAPPARPAPATPLHLREETTVFPPGQSPSVPRPAPTPI